MLSQVRVNNGNIFKFWVNYPFKLCIFVSIQPLITNNCCCWWNIYCNPRFSRSVLSYRMFWAANCSQWTNREGQEKRGAAASWVSLLTCAHTHTHTNPCYPVAKRLLIYTNCSLWEHPFGSVCVLHPHSHSHRSAHILWGYVSYEQLFSFFFLGFCSTNYPLIINFRCQKHHSKP